MSDAPASNITLLLLGGTAEARALAGRLAGTPGLSVTLSLAGRTAHPAPHPVPVRVGGFGGAEGLAQHLRAQAVSCVVDATHPYAAQISRNAAMACAAAGVPLLALRRPGWTAQAGDDWHEVADIAEAVDRLGPAPRRVFLALGRNEVRAFEAAPQHAYLVRSVDPVRPPLAVPRADYVVARGPFAVEGEQALFIRHGIEVIVAKNSGGPSTYAKMAAARALGCPVLLLRRPALPDVPETASLAEAEAWIHAHGALRGV